MNNSKNKIVVCCFAMLGLTSCMMPSPQIMSQAMAVRGIGMGNGGSGGLDAEEFSKKLITLKVGVATKEDCLAKLGQPAMKTDDSLMYTLNTGSVFEPAPVFLSFKNNILSNVNVSKITRNGGTGTTEVNKVYSR